MNDDSTYKRSQLRLPHDLHAAVVKAADENGRSMNNEIVSRLEASFVSKAEEHPDLLTDLLTDEVFSSFDEEEQAALDAIDTSTVPGMVEWLDVIARYQAKHSKLEAMVAEAVRLHKEKAASAENAQAAETPPNAPKSTKRRK